ncbi:TPA: hypothetical protein ACH3X1_016233 [Trebouxia sp. C0004]
MGKTRSGRDIAARPQVGGDTEDPNCTAHRLLVVQTTSPEGNIIRRLVKKRDRIFKRSSRLLFIHVPPTPKPWLKKMRPALLSLTL